MLSCLELQANFLKFRVPKSSMGRSAGTCSPALNHPRANFLNFASLKSDGCTVVQGVWTLHNAATA